ncbi:MAG: fasciclin domain-containing protein [Thermoplasmatota archaeon]
MENIAQKVKGDRNLKKLWNALEEADLEDVLEGEGPYTVFAPTNEAFEKMSERKLKKLLGDKNELKKVLKYHIIPGKYTSRDVSKMKTARTMSGDDIKINTKKGVKVNKSKVIKPDIECSNGEIHLIDTPLTPKKGRLW